MVGAEVVTPSEGKANMSVVAEGVALSSTKKGGAQAQGMGIQSAVKKQTQGGRGSVISSKYIPSHAKLASKAISHNGMISTIVYVILVTLLAISTYGLDTMANTPVSLGTVELEWDKNRYDLPITTLMKGSTTMEKVKTHVLTQNISHGTHSLADLQYDKCGENDDPCVERFRPNTERVLYSLARSFSMISSFDVPEFVASNDKIVINYVNTMYGNNYPAAQFSIPGNKWGVTCIIRRNRYRIAQEEANTHDIDSYAICSKRKYDPDWGCESDVNMDAATHIIKIQQGRVTYLGSAPRGEMYYNPGKIAKLSGGPKGTGFFSTVTVIDEYNGIIQSSAPWDVAPVYLCKGTFNPETNLGMLWRGQGIAVMTWQSSSLMVTNSLALWAITMSLAVVQCMYLRNSSICVIPVHMAKTLVGPVILGFACYSNYNVQVLTTFFNNNSATNFNVTPYRLCGPAMFSSVISVMSGTAIQMFFNPLLVSPSYIPTIVSITNWIVVFILEAFIFPKQSAMIQQPCVLPSSNSCSRYSAIDHNYFLSPIIGACAITAGILVILYLQRCPSKPDVSPKNSVLKLLNTKSIRALTTSGRGGCVVAGADSTALVDAGILLNKNLVQVSKAVVVRSSNVKYVILHRLLPTMMATALSRAVGTVLVIKAQGDRVTSEIAFLELDDMGTRSAQTFPSYYS